MAIRTTAALVRSVMEPGNDYNGTSDLTIFIRIATRLVDRVVASAIVAESPLTDEDALLMETLLGAHYYKQSHQQHAENAAGKARVKFTGKTGLGLSSTRYGQAAMDLDPSGQLVAITTPAEGRNTVGAAWLGEEEA